MTYCRNFWIEYNAQLEYMLSTAILGYQTPGPKGDGLTCGAALYRNARTLLSRTNIARTVVMAGAAVLACAGCSSMHSLDSALPSNAAANADTAANIETNSQAPILCDNNGKNETDDCLQLFKGLATR